MFLKFFYVIHFLLIFFIIFLILIQQGRGANTGMVNKDYTVLKSQSLLNTKNSSDFIFKIICILIFLYFFTNLTLNKLTYKEQMYQKNVRTLEKNSTFIKNDGNITLPIVPK